MEKSWILWNFEIFWKSYGILSLQFRGNPANREKVICMFGSGTFLNVNTVD